MQKNLYENPYIAAYYFNRRYIAFFEEVIKLKFGIID